MVDKSELRNLFPDYAQPCVLDIADHVVPFDWIMVVEQCKVQVIRLVISETIISADTNRSS